MIWKHKLLAISIATSVITIGLEALAMSSATAATSISAVGQGIAAEQAQSQEIARNLTRAADRYYALGFGTWLIGTACFIASIARQETGVFLAFAPWSLSTALMFLFI